MLPKDKETVPASAGVVSHLLAVGPAGGAKKRSDFRSLINRIDLGVSVGA